MNHIAVVSIAKNIEETLEDDYKRINTALADWDKISWIVIESDSADQSIDVLNELTAKNENFYFKSLGKLQNQFFKRTELLAYARNEYLKELKKPEFKNLEYVCVVDLNNLNSHISLNSVRSCWEKRDWDVCTANQYGPYYDIWALRHELWSPNDCWEEFEFYKKFGMKSEFALQKSVYSRMLKIPVDGAWIEVDSSFGGFAIYKYKFLMETKYSGLKDNNESICEHVSVNLQIRKLGGKIYINPKLVNTNYTDHSKNSKLSSHIKRYICNSFKILKKL